ncbi:MAG: polysaccharide deacetylase family protein [Verrucomicrobiota bacterium]
MIVLNYHRVGGSDPPAFYTVTRADFEDHLKIVRELGLRSIPTEDVLASDTDHGAIMLHFDDGTDDHFHNVAPLLQQFGMKGVFFISTSKIQKEGYLSVEQIQELAVAGHSIECHGHTHRRLDQLTEEELDNELTTSILLIKEWTGRAPRILAPPGGFFNKAVIDAAAFHGLRIIRSMKWGKNTIPVGNRIDCFVITRFTSVKTIRKWLLGRGLVLMRIQYWLKQIIRSLLPKNLYLMVRQLAKWHHTVSLIVTILTGTLHCALPFSQSSAARILLARLMIISKAPKSGRVAICGIFPLFLTSPQTPIVSSVG